MLEANQQYRIILEKLKGFNKQRKSRIVLDGYKRAEQYWQKNVLKANEREQSKNENYTN
jgi:hypothetical protein